MKRQTVALLLQPFKNRLMPVQMLGESIDRFFVEILGLTSEFPHLRLNCGLPAYILEKANSLHLSKLRNLFKNEMIEYLLTGYTEPFLSLSPLALTKENIKHGLDTFTELTGVSPIGYLPPFSNWEPSIIETLRETGLSYAVLAQELFPSNIQNRGGFWTVEHAGNSISIFPSTVIQSTNAPADFIDWLVKTFQNAETNDTERILTVQYLVPLNPIPDIDPYRWLKFAAAELDKHLLNFQPVRFTDCMSVSHSNGFQYIPSSMLTEAHGQADRHFLNYLYSHDQAGILQRKLVDVNDQLALCGDQKTISTLRKKLFFAQDINRLMPGKESGFTHMTDRLWSYARLIEVEHLLDEKKYNDDGKIQITDFFKNGSKVLILSNNRLKVYIDYKKGGQVFMFDYRDRSLNLAAAYTPELHDPPDIISPEKSRTWFLDRILPSNCSGSDFASGLVPCLSGVHRSAFEYKISARTSGIKASLIRNAAFSLDEKSVPLVIEKVFGLEKKRSVFTFVYQLTNPSLVPYTFKFTTELNFSIPSCASNDLQISSGTTVYKKPGWEFNQIEDVTKWAIEDKNGGIRILFQTQKPLTLWCIPPNTSTQQSGAIHGLRIVLTSEVTLKPNTPWKMIGKIVCRKYRIKGNAADVC